MNDKIQDSQKMEPRLEEKLNQLEILRQSLEEKRKLARESHDKFLRLAADFDNYRKRTEKEKRELIEFAEENLLLSLLPILDSFQEATSEQIKKSKPEDLIKGAKLIYKQFKKILEKEGLKKIETVGKKFDPEIHHAIEYKESGKHKEGEIVEEIQAGYFFGKKIIRPAGVIVAKKSTDKHG